MIVRHMSINEATAHLNEICVNDIIMSHPIFSVMNKLSLLRMSLPDKAVLVSILTGLGRNSVMMLEDGTLIPNFIPKGHHVQPKETDSNRVPTQTSPPKYNYIGDRIPHTIANAGNIKIVLFKSVDSTHNIS